MKYGIIGSTGRMGTEIKNLFDEHSHECVFTYEKNGEIYVDDPEVIIDFSLPEVFDKTFAYSINMKKPLIIGTTGLSEFQLEQLKILSEIVPVVQSYNFSIGIQMMMMMTRFLSKNLNDWDIEISETHHRFKKDKPSGTAKMLSKEIEKDVIINSQRLGNVTGEHTVYFGGLGEIISIKHEALSRRTFAEGVLKSAEFIKNKQSGFYSFTEVLGL